MTETGCRGHGSLCCRLVVLEIKTHSKTKYALATTAKPSHQRKAMSAKGVNSHVIRYPERNKRISQGQESSSCGGSVGRDRLLGTLPFLLSTRQASQEA